MATTATNKARSYSLTGELYLSKSGWLLLAVPNDIGRGSFKALNEPGIELPADPGGQYNAHISVMRPEEIEQIGGADVVTERGKEFGYALGHLHEFEPEGWEEVEKCWAIEVHSPDLEKLRKSYGLSALPRDGKHKFHITVAIRRRRVLGANSISKAPDVPEKTDESEAPSFRIHDKPGIHLIKASNVLAGASRRISKYPGLVKQADFSDALRSLIEPLVRQFLQTHGLQLGQFWPNKNWQDVLEEQRFMDFKNEAMRQAAAQDSGPLKILHGFNSILGGNWQPSMAQNNVLQQGFAQIEPYLQRWSPKFYDQLFGGTGSIASLTSAIADAHRYDNSMTPERAAGHAKAIFDEMYADPMRHRGFSAHQLGEIYREAAKRGLVTRGASPEQLSEQLTPLVGIASAIRDTTAGTDTPKDIPSIFQQYDAHQAQYAGQSPAQIESNIRQNMELRRQGGTMAAALRRSGRSLGNAGDPTLDELTQQNEQLTENAKNSTVARMVAATAKLKSQGLIKPESAADKFLQDASSGRVTIGEPMEWAKLIAQSSQLRPAEAQVYLNNDDYKRFLTPDLVAGIRSSQGALDMQPFLQSIEKSYTDEQDPRHILRDAERDNFVQSHGYKNWQNYQLLQGQPAQNISTVMADAGNRARTAQNVSHVGWHTPVQRAVDAFKEPAPSVESVGKAVFNVLPNASSPVAPTPPTPQPPMGPPVPTAPPAAPPIKSAFDKAAVGPGYRGIPDRADMGDLSKLSPDEILDLIIQRHDAVRAGTHRDFRLGDPSRGLYSWAMRAEGLPAPGQKVLANRQPLHAHAYGSFQGTLGPGYGQGTVRREHKGRILVTQASPTKIEFTTAGTSTPERFVLFKPKKFGDKQWLLMNVTATEAPPTGKPRFKTVPADQVEATIDQMQNGATYQKKLDGARSLTKLMNGGVEVLSYRTSKRTGGPITHTERVFGGRPKITYPKELEGTTLVGELLARNADKVMPPQVTGGLLNATIEHSRKMQKAKGLDLYQTLFDAQTIGKKPIDYAKTPYADRRKIIEQILPYLPKDKMRIISQETTPEGGKALWRQIASGQDPDTTEGMVIQPLTGNPIKAKLVNDADVHIRAIFPGEGKYRGIGAGGFDYALDPEGKIVGRVGTGFSDDTRKDMWTHPENYIGRIARIHSQQQLPSGAYRAPGFLALHEG